MEADRGAWEPVGVAESNGGRGLLRNQRAEPELVVCRVAGGNQFVVGSECLALVLCVWSWKVAAVVAAVKRAGGFVARPRLLGAAESGRWRE